MITYFGFDNFDTSIISVATVGTFDGVHLGHQKLIQQLKEKAKSVGGKSLIITFWPHPRFVVQTDGKPLQLLNTLEEKLALLEKQSIDYVLVIPFDKQLADTDYHTFVKDILVDKIGIKHLLVGYDHQFGRDRKGDFTTLKELSNLYNFQVDKIDAEQVNEINISSTKIRTSLQEGEIDKANQFLGYQYYFSGEVVEGKKLGRTIDFPTANIKVSEDFKLLPADGVYAVMVEIEGQSSYGMMNIGAQPTFNIQHKALEINILNFNEDIYSKKITVILFHKLRNVTKFENVNALINQLQVDRESTKKYFRVA
jgi:riboflavin kinase/FMN adenylyltransferase